jgi:hypothetical protein
MRANMQVVHPRHWHIQRKTCPTLRKPRISVALHHPMAKAVATRINKLVSCQPNMSREERLLRRRIQPHNGIGRLVYAKNIDCKDFALLRVELIPITGRGGTFRGANRFKIICRPNRKDALFDAARATLAECPGCGRRRKWKWRRGRSLKLSVLGLDFELPSPNVECPHCNAPAVGVVKLLAGLRSGDSSTELELQASREGARHTYREASEDLKAHHGQDVERTKVRRMSFKVESEVVEFAEEMRDKADEAGLPPQGATALISEADGGSARTGKLVP